MVLVQCWSLKCVTWGHYCPTSSVTSAFVTVRPLAVIIHAIYMYLFCAYIVFSDHYHFTIALIATSLNVTVIDSYIYSWETTKMQMPSRVITGTERHGLAAELGAHFCCMPTMQYCCYIFDFTSECITAASCSISRQVGRSWLSPLTFCECLFYLWEQE